MAIPVSVTQAIASLLSDAPLTGSRRGGKLESANREEVMVIPDCNVQEQAFIGELRMVVTGEQEHEFEMKFTSSGYI